jgi:hypothetical protein
MLECSRLAKDAHVSEFQSRATGFSLPEVQREKFGCLDFQVKQLPYYCEPSGYQIIEAFSKVLEYQAKSQHQLVM